MGPQINQEKLVANITPALETLMLSVVVAKLEANSFAALNREVLLKVAPIAIQLVTPTTVHLRHAG